MLGAVSVSAVHLQVGGDVFNALSRLMAAEGRLLVVGFASGTIATLKTNLPLLKGYSVVGVRSGAEMIRRQVDVPVVMLHHAASRYATLCDDSVTRRCDGCIQDYAADMKRAMGDLAAKGQLIFPITVVPVGEAARGYRLMTERTAAGKVVLSMRLDSDHELSSFTTAKL